jgi:hypothetical protein
LVDSGPLGTSRDNLLYVSGLDAIAGTPVLDIKPYYERKLFSLPLLHTYALKKEMRQEIFLKQGLNHHGEKCAGLLLGVRMALIADEYYWPT